MQHYICHRLCLTGNALNPIGIKKLSNLVSKIHSNLLGFSCTAVKRCGSILGVDKIQIHSNFWGPAAMQLSQVCVTWNFGKNQIQLKFIQRSSCTVYCCHSLCGKSSNPFVIQWKPRFSYVLLSQVETSNPFVIQLNPSFSSVLLSQVECELDQSLPLRAELAWVKVNWKCWKRWKMHITK